MNCALSIPLLVPCRKEEPEKAFFFPALLQSRKWGFLAPKPPARHGVMEHPQVCGLLLTYLQLVPLCLPLIPGYSPKSLLPGSASTQPWESPGSEFWSGVLVVWGHLGSTFTCLPLPQPGTGSSWALM